MFYAAPVILGSAFFAVAQAVLESGVAQISVENVHDVIIVCRGALRAPSCFGLRSVRKAHLCMCKMTDLFWHLQHRCVGRTLQYRDGGAAPIPPLFLLPQPLLRMSQRPVVSSPSFVPLYGRQTDCPLPHAPLVLLAYLPDAELGRTSRKPRP